MKTHFTIDEANRLIPSLKQQILAARQELSELHAELRARQDNLLAVELAKRELVIRRQMGPAWQRLEDRWQLLARELEASKVAVRVCHAAWTERFETQGILVRDLATGLVDFPATHNGREVLLCWLLDEQRVAYWHGQREGFNGRKPLADLASDGG